MIWFWAAGAVLLVLAGFAAVWVPHRRTVAERRRVAWVTAHAAIETASVSRDASPARLGEAEDLLSKAEQIAAHRGGPSAAESATELARRADQLWRAHD